MNYCSRFAIQYKFVTNIGCLICVHSIGVYGTVMICNSKKLTGQYFDVCDVFISIYIAGHHRLPSFIYLCHVLDDVISYCVHYILCLDAAAESTDFHIIFLSDETEDCSAGNATSSELVRRMREVIQMQSQTEPTINIGTITLPNVYITTCIYKLKKHSCLAGRYLKTNQ